MSEKQETLAEIVAEMRKRDNHDPTVVMRVRELTEYADRIEAAWKRERAEIEADALYVGGVVEAARNKPSGDAAAQREALEMAKVAIETAKKKMGVDNPIILEIIDAALAKPPRNCDRFADELDAQIAFLNEVWLISVTKESLLEHDKFENWTDEMKARYAAWLFATANEKGETDASK